MSPDHASRLTLRQILRNFEDKKPELNHVQYLESELKRLETLRLKYASESQNPENQPRIRARARDLEQNVAGIYHGIMFSLSFILHQDKELKDIVEMVNDTFTS